MVWRSQEQCGRCFNMENDTTLCSSIAQCAAKHLVGSVSSEDHIWLCSERKKRIYTYSNEGEAAIKKLSIGCWTNKQPLVLAT